MDYSDALKTLYAQAPGRFKLGLDCMDALLAALGRPEERLRIISVAGTNGKGFSAALLARTLELAGHRVGLYTSPHLFRFTERIRVNGEETDEDELTRVIEEVLSQADACPRPPTFFEYATAIALLTFAQRGVEWAVLEVGLGGRLDATNVSRKALCMFTPIGIDHTDYLGDTLSAIAHEKAGILRGLTGDAISSEQDEEAARVLRQQAQSHGVVLHEPPFPPVKRQTHRPEFQWPLADAVGAALPLLGRHGCRASTEHFEEALRTLYWPGRYEWRDGEPPILIDGAHNVAALEALCRALEVDLRAHAKPLHVVFSPVADKDATGMLSILRSRGARIYFCPNSSPRGRTRDALAALAEPDTEHCFGSLQDALTHATNAAHQEKGVVVITGSLFLVGDALAYFDQEKRDPPVIG